VIIILNKIDQARSEQDKIANINHVKEIAATVLKIRTNDLKIFPISALDNIGIKELEQYIRSTLTSENKVTIKLQNPLGIQEEKDKIYILFCLGICEKLLKDYSKTLVSRQKILDENLKLLNALEKDVNDFRKDMLTDFKFQLNKVDNIFLQMKDNNDKFFSKNMSYTKVIKMLYTGTGDLDALYHAQVNKNTQQVCDDIFSQIFFLLIIEDIC
jgi:hypothetical protein